MQQTDILVLVGVGVLAIGAMCVGLAAAWFSGRRYAEATPALEDRANVAACKLVAKLLGVAPSRIEIVRGARSRDKVLRVQGVDAAQVRELLGLQG